MKYTALSLITMLGIASCGAPARRSEEAPVVRPSEVADFRLLYTQNCSGCHGADGQGALSVGIGRPVYLAIADDASIRRVTEEGRPGTPMPAFAQKAGGMLTDAQVDILVHGIRTHWAKAGAFEMDKPPAYAVSQQGDAERGHNLFNALCSSCHGSDGHGARAIADSSYLELVSDQHLRTVIIIGMPHLGMPDWRSHNKPLSDADVTDTVAWLASQRQQPLSTKLNPPGGSQ
jgi:cytochrome c oxidase cbb3-type subunit 3